MNRDDSFVDWLKETFTWTSLVPTPATAGAARAGWLLAQSSGGSGDKPTVRVTRRRAPSSGDRERADAPSRDSGGAPPPPSSKQSGGGYTRPPSGSGRPLPGGPRMPLAGGGMIVILLLCAVVFFLFRGGGGGGGDNVPSELVSAQLTAQPEQAQQQEPPTPRPTRTPRPVAAAAGAQAGGSTADQTWTIMLYQDADDKILEKDIYVDLNEAERVGSSDRVNVVAQVDRFRAGYEGDGNWTGTRRYHVTQDDDLQTVRSELVEDLGEANMSDGNTLVDFATWAIENYPADNYVLILSDHGMGWPGGWSDPTATDGGDSRIPLAAALGSQLYLNELDDALGEIRSRTGVDKFEMIGMDACLMGHMEVFSALAPHARYAVASQETEPALGWAYTGFLGDLVADPNMSGADLSQLIVDSYIQEDQRIVDDEARAEFLGQGRGLGSLFGGPSAADLAQQLEKNITLTALDLQALPALTDALNNLAYTLQETNQKAVAQARSYAQSFTSIFGKEVPASYIDLGNFGALLKESTRDGNVGAAVDQLMAAMGGAIIAEKHGPGKPGATGVSVYFPNSQLYGNPVAGVKSYVPIAARFADESLWDDFLAFHYTGREFDPAPVAARAAPSVETVRAPGQGDIQVSPITASAQVAAPGQPVLLSVDIGGENVGYVKLFAGYVDSDSKSIYVADQDYLQSTDTREVDGVYYPVWPEGGEFTMEFEWEPIVFAISDGANRAEAVFTPETYGAAPEDAMYTVDGIYKYADGETRPARLYFRDGALQQVFGFTGDGFTGAPREIVPTAGDQFTVLENWMDLDAQGRVVKTATEEGKTLTFGDEPWQWIDLDAAAGDYVVGFLVEDLDGNSTAQYTTIQVR